MEHALKQYRSNEGVPISRLAEIAKTSRQTIFRIEKGSQSPSLDLVQRLIEATNGKVTASDFLPAQATKRRAV